MSQAKNRFEKIKDRYSSVADILFGAILGSVFSIGFYVFIRQWEWNDLDVWAIRVSVLLVVVFLIFIVIWSNRRVLLDRLFGATHTDVASALDTVSQGLTQKNNGIVVHGLKDAFIVWTAVKMRWTVATITILLMGNILLVTNAAMLVKQTKVLTEELDRKKSISLFDIDEKLALDEAAIQISAYILMPDQRKITGLPWNPLDINRYLYWVNRIGVYYKLGLLNNDELEESYGGYIKAFFKTPEFCNYYNSNVKISPETMSGLTELGTQLAQSEIEQCIDT